MSRNVDNKIMKLVAYDEKGNFIGIYDDITYKLKYDTIKINRDVYQKLLIGIYKIKIESVKNFEKDILTLDTYLEVLEEIDSKLPIKLSPSPIQMIGEQAIESKLKLIEANNKIDKQEEVLKVLGMQIVELKLKAISGGSIHE